MSDIPLETCWAFNEQVEWWIPLPSCILLVIYAQHVIISALGIILALDAGCG